MQGHGELGTLQGLVQEAQELARQLGAGQDRSVGFRGKDPTDTIQVVIDSTGRVRQVEVGEDWRDTVGLSGLGPAIQAAVTHAAIRRLRDWGAAVAKAGDGPDGAEPGGSAASERPAKAGSSTDDGVRPLEDAGMSDDAPGPCTVGELLALLDGLDRELDAVTREVEERARREFRGRGSTGWLTVTVRGGQVVKVDVDKRRAVDANHVAISREAMAAFDAAFEAAGATPAPALPVDGPLAAIRAVAEDPEALFRRLGLREHSATLRTDVGPRADRAPGRRVDP